EVNNVPDPQSTTWQVLATSVSNTQGTFTIQVPQGPGPFARLTFLDQQTGTPLEVTSSVPSVYFPKNQPPPVIDVWVRPQEPVEATAIRLEVVGVDPSLGEGLRNRVGDPLWLLARQWQLGEFRAEDRASPVFIDARIGYSRVDHYQSGQSAWIALGEQEAPL